MRRRVASRANTLACVRIPRHRLSRHDFRSAALRVICFVCRALLLKIFSFGRDPNHFIFLPSCSTRGRIAIVTDAERDAMDAGGALTRAHACGRRSRVVLTPRRWRQVGGGNSAGDGDKQARSPGRVRRKPLKPLRAGMPGVSGATVVTNSCAFYTLHARLRVHWAPGIPHALVWAKTT